MSETTSPEPTPAPTPQPTAPTAAAPPFPIREITVPGGPSLEMSSDLAIPPGCSLTKI